MNVTQESQSALKFRVGIFTLLGLLLIGAITVFVNDKPFWWRPCDLVHINVEDATGLKTKSPIRSLGIQIGYLQSVALAETQVRLGICITAPVEVLPSTRAYIRGEGFLGDKFVELKPVRYLGEKALEKPANSQNHSLQSIPVGPIGWLLDQLLPSAAAQETKRRNAQGREIPVGEKSQDMEHLVGQVDGLVDEMRKLTNNLKDSFDPAQMKNTLQRLNSTLENASRTLSPEGGLNTTAQRTLAKLEDAIEQFQDQMTRINHGEGSLGKLLNDPVYANELKKAAENLNSLLNKAANLRFTTDLGAVALPVLGSSGRGTFQLQIWPRQNRYYLLGVSLDPRGTQKTTNTETTENGTTTTKSVVTTEPNSMLITVLLGKRFSPRLDLAVGILHGDGTITAQGLLGPAGREELLAVRADFYTRGGGGGVDFRPSIRVQPLLGSSDVFGPLYFTGGLESIRQTDGKTNWFAGAGIRFEDEDIKALISLLL